VVTKLSKQIREWEEPVMVHESLRKLASVVKVPEAVIGVDQQFIPETGIQRSGSARALGGIEVDPNRILEMDLLRWVILLAKKEPQLLEWIRKQVSPEDLLCGLCQETYRTLLLCHDRGDSIQLLTLAAAGGRAQSAVDELAARKVHAEKARELIVVTVREILNRNWMLEKQELCTKIQGKKGAADEEMQLIREYGLLQKSPPTFEALPEEVRQASGQ
jgi:DNA primase